MQWSEDKYPGRRAPGPVSARFDSAALAHRRRSGQNELLGRAVGWKSGRAPSVLDATAGFARDAYVLADLGCRVLLSEREPVLHALLAQALSHGRELSATAAACARMSLHPGDARELEGSVLSEVDVIYLDPMFAAPRRAAVGKAMQALQRLTDAGENAVDDARQLLQWARRQAVGRVVRPAAVDHREAVTVPQQPEIDVAQAAKGHRDLEPEYAGRDFVGTHVPVA